LKNYIKRENRNAFMKKKQEKSKRIKRPALLFPLLLAAAVFIAILFISPKKTSDTDFIQMRSHSAYEKYLNTSQQIYALSFNYTSRVELPPELGAVVLEMKGERKEGMRWMAEEGVQTSSAVNEPVKIRIYISGTNMHYCLADAPCTNFSLITSLDRGHLLELSGNIYAKGALIFNDVKERGFEHRNCTFFNINYDISRLSTEEKYLLLSSSGLASVSNPESAAGKITAYNLQFCEEKGITLFSRSALLLGNITIKAETTVATQSIASNSMVDESTVSVPD
jgi:hypothetical protein